jgi:hypothetical protein
MERLAEQGGKNADIECCCEQRNESDHGEHIPGATFDDSDHNQQSACEKPDESARI